MLTELRIVIGHWIATLALLGCLSIMLTAGQWVITRNFITQSQLDISIDKVRDDVADIMMSYRLLYITDHIDEIIVMMQQTERGSKRYQMLNRQLDIYQARRTELIKGSIDAGSKLPAKG